MKNRSITGRQGFTLAELLIVLLIVVALAGIVVPLIASPSVATAAGQRTAAELATERSLRTVRDVLLGTDGQPGYFADLGHWPAAAPGAYPQLHYLFVNPATDTPERDFDPVTRRGWRGPYLADSGLRYVLDNAAGFVTQYGEPGDYAVPDGWGRPLVVQYDGGLQTWQVVSAGSDGRLDTEEDNLAVDLR